ncbi:MAG: tRNA (N(6)-L-threonylcarbamoyladenosine(37)-C(2))-methylthiotransferase MtaB [Parachlamydiales bacterium]
MSKRLKTVTLGCRTNQYESSAFASQLKALGYEGSEGEPDLCIVNTCTVTGEAHKASQRAVRRLLREHPKAKVVVTGCAVAAKGGLGPEFEGKVEIVPNGEKESLARRLHPEAESLPEFKIDHFAAHTRAFVKVQDGCNSYCSYCIIPFVRGRSRSRPREEVIAEVEGLIGSGYKEVVLTGINIGDFDGGGTLADLVREVDGIEGLKRLRLSSIDPDEVDDSLASALLEGRHTCPSMHIVLQSGSNITLKRMRRKYTLQQFYATAQRLRAARSDFTFTTDVIVGFPGETEADHEATLRVIEEIAFAKVHVFPYSDRAGTRASRMEGKVPKGVSDRRKRELIEAAERSALALREPYVGRELEVLWESIEGDQISGHTDNFLLVSAPAEGRGPNTLSTVVPTRNTPGGLKV